MKNNMHKFPTVIFIYLFLSLCLNAEELNNTLAESDNTKSEIFNIESGLYKKMMPRAEHGDAVAQSTLGMMYLYGFGVKRNYKQALKWSRLAAEQGDAWGHHNLGDMYQFGKGVPKDAVLAYMWWNLAAANSTFTGASIERNNISKKMTPSQIEEAQKLSRECLKKEYKNCY